MASGANAVPLKDPKTSTKRGRDATTPGQDPKRTAVEEASSQGVVAKKIEKLETLAAENAAKCGQKELFPATLAEKEVPKEMFPSPSAKFLGFLDSKATAGASNNLTSQTPSASSSSLRIQSVVSAKKNNVTPPPPPDGFAAARGEEAIIRGTQNMELDDVGSDQ